MTKAQALKLARAKWGESAHVRRNPRARPVEERRAAHDEVVILRARRGDQTTHDDYLEWKRRVDELTIRATSEPYGVGYLSAIAFHVRGSGDSWEEACRKAGLLTP